MSTTTKWLAALIACAAAAATFGFGFGVRVALYEQWLRDSSARASVLAHELRLLRSGNAGLLIDAKEAELDAEIAKYGRYLEEGRRWVWWPQSSSYDHDKYMKNVADYRKQYPTKHGK